MFANRSGITAMVLHLYVHTPYIDINNSCFSANYCSFFIYTRNKFQYPIRN